jgi:hypothetical protein
MFNFKLASIGLYTLMVIAIAALVIGSVALYYSTNSSASKKSSCGNKSSIQFAGGIMSETSTGNVLLNTGAAIAVGFGNYSDSTVLTNEEQVRSYSFVAPYDGYLRNLEVNVAAAAQTGATGPLFATIYTSTVCGEDLAPTKLSVFATISDVRTDFCVKDSCHRLKVCKGDRVALVLSGAGPTLQDSVILFNVSAGLEYDAK